MHHLAQIGKDDRSTNISAVKNTTPGLSGIISSVSTRKKGGFLSPLSCRIPVFKAPLHLSAGTAPNSAILQKDDAEL